MITGDAVPELHKPVVGAVAKLPPLALPHNPLTRLQSLCSQLALLPLQIPLQLHKE
jgi:hypothetical protein